MRSAKLFGKIIVAVGRRPSDSEFAVAEVFAKLGFDVVFLPENRTKGARSADVQMDGVDWEIKSPTGKGKRTIDKQFHRATGQSHNIIIDSRYSAIPFDRFREMVEKQWEGRRAVRRLILIAEDGKILDFRR